MACQSSPGQLYAAPYALVGSIGIISSTINFRGLLESHGVDAIVLKGGKEKVNNKESRLLTVLYSISLFRGEVGLNYLA